MDLWNTIKEQANNAIAGSGSNITDFLKQNASTLFVKTGPAPSGNLTPAQISAGQSGAPPAMAAPASGVQAMMSNPMIPMLVIGGLVVVALLMKKGR